MCRGVGELLGGDIHLNNGAVSANDGDILSAGRLNGLSSSDSPFPRKYDVHVLELAGISVHTNQPDPIRSGTENIELIRSWVGDEAAGAAIAEMHASTKKLAGLRVEGGEQERIGVFRFGGVDQDSKRQSIAGNRHG